MSGSFTQSFARLDALQAEHEALTRRNGRLEFAQEVAEWVHEHRDQLPAHIRESISALILRA